MGEGANHVRLTFLVNLQYTRDLQDTPARTIRNIGELHNHPSNFASDCLLEHLLNRVSRSLSIRHSGRLEYGHRISGPQMGDVIHKVYKLSTAIGEGKKYAQIAFQCSRNFR